MTKENINIIYEEDDNTIVDFNNFLNEMEKTDIDILYETNYNKFTIKELLLICEYYGIAKELKIHKCCKDVIIQFLVDFESIPLNNTIVLRRQEMWRCINILKNDKFMKKYVLW